MRLRHVKPKSKLWQKQILRPQDGPFPEYSSAAIQKLEDDVVEEMVARRKSKANRNSTAKAPHCITRYISRYISRYFGI